ncbi:hypothetical protein EVAR_48720_1 [Eumeta japonica]|uniref:Uncharacterized protein n=1 Tax=Eumeta variegata TaxID=151549 RepID=A0A4C1XFD9_EUMVA|nr:hypothetical protein EVAR_48720_1 [Eumeta japonica]
MILRLGGGCALRAAGVGRRPALYLPREGRTPRAGRGKAGGSRGRPDGSVRCAAAARRAPYSTPLDAVAVDSLLILLGRLTYWMTIGRHNPPLWIFRIHDPEPPATNVRLRPLPGQSPSGRSSPVARSRPDSELKAGLRSEPRLKEIDIENRTSIRIENGIAMGIQIS